MKIAPSLLSADFGRLREQVEMLNASAADRIHVDVMDGRFVPNISFGFPVMDMLQRVATKPLDVHLMIVEPERYAEAFVKSGASYLSFHIEACPHAHRLLNQIRHWGAKAGLALNPQTGLDWVPSLGPEMDFVNIMTVNPGFGGQSFIASQVEKLASLNQLRATYNWETEIDGGVNRGMLELIRNSPPDVAVAGAAVFGASDPLAEIESLSRFPTA